MNEELSRLRQELRNLKKQQQEIQVRLETAGKRLALLEEKGRFAAAEAQKPPAAIHGAVPPRPQRRDLFP